MFHPRMVTLFILFHSLSLAFEIANPLQHRQDSNTSTITLSSFPSPSPFISPSSISSSQSTSTQIADSVSSSDTTTPTVHGAIQTGSTTSENHEQTGLSAETGPLTSKDSVSHTMYSSTTPTGSVTQKVLTTIVSTSGGVTLSITSTSSKVVAAALASATSSGALGLSGSNGGSGSPGLSSKTKSVIGGVVGGVGGAILLGGLAIVFWRVWGKNRSSHGADNDLMDTQRGPEKSSSFNSHSPFRSTLDQYHNPGPVNTASNF